MYRSQAVRKSRRTTVDTLDSDGFIPLVCNSHIWCKIIFCTYDINPIACKHAHPMRWLYVERHDMLSRVKELRRKQVNAAAAHGRLQSSEWLSPKNG